MHDEHKHHHTRDIGEWRDKLARQSRVSRALQAQRVERKYEAEWTTRAKRGQEPR